MKKIIKASWILLMAMIIFAGIPTLAKTKNVTKSFKDKKKVEELVNHFYCLGNLGNASTYDFAKGSHRRNALKWIAGGCYSEYGNGSTVPASITNSISKRIFGCNTSGLSDYTVGDWGGAFPKLESFQYYQKSSTTFTVTADLYWFEENEECPYSEIQGTISVDIKRKKGSFYGYVAKKLQIKPKKKTVWKTLSKTSLSHTWYNSAYYKGTEWSGMYASAYKTTFKKNGTVTQIGYRNKDIGTYKISKDKKKAVATYNKCYFDTPGKGYVKCNTKYTVTYRLDSNYKLHAKYSSAATETNAGTGYLCRIPENMDIPTFSPLSSNSGQGNSGQGNSGNTSGTWSDWSGWTTTPVTASNDVQVETKTQYSYRDKSTTTSSSSSLNGWTLYDSKTSFGSWSGWSDWQTDPITGSDTVSVQTATVYPYYYFRCANCGTHSHGWGTGACYTWIGGCGSYIQEGSWTQRWDTTPWAYNDWHGTGKYYQMLNGERWFQWPEAGGAKTGYRKQTRTKTTTYYFYKWSEWSAFDDIQRTPDATREVNTRALYRSREKVYR